MTELSPVSHTTPDDGCEPPGVSGDVPKGSVGYAIPNTECRLIDPETGEDAAEGERGELWIRGPQVMKGYLNNDEATADTIDADGWLHTGDVAVVDDARLLHRRRPGQGADQVQGLPGGPGRARGRAARAPGDRRRRGHRRARQGERRGAAQGLRRPGAGLGDHRGRGHGVHGRQGGPAQEDPLRRVHRRGAEVGGRQDPAQGPQGPRIARQASDSSGDLAGATSAGGGPGPTPAPRPPPACRPARTRPRTRSPASGPARSPVPRGRGRRSRRASASG